MAQQSEYFAGMSQQSSVILKTTENLSKLWYRILCFHFRNQCSSQDKHHISLTPYCCPCWLAFNTPMSGSRDPWVGPWLRLLISNIALITTHNTAPSAVARHMHVEAELCYFYYHGKSLLVLISHLLFSSSRNQCSSQDKQNNSLTPYCCSCR